MSGNRARYAARADSVQLRSSEVALARPDVTGPTRDRLSESLSGADKTQSHLRRALPRHDQGRRSVRYQPFFFNQASAAFATFAKSFSWMEGMVW